MTFLRLTDPDELPLLPEGTLLNVPGVAEPIIWLRAFSRPHQDPDTGLWRLPCNPFAEHEVTIIEARLPDADDRDPAPRPLQGDEDWLSTLDDPHDTTH